MTMNMAERVYHPLIDMGDLIFPSIWVGSLEKVRNCGLAILRTQNA